MAAVGFTVLLLLGGDQVQALGGLVVGEHGIGGGGVQLLDLAGELRGKRAQFAVLLQGVLASGPAIASPEAGRGSGQYHCDNAAEHPRQQLRLGGGGWRQHVGAPVQPADR